MRKQLEILMLQYKEKNCLDVYSELDYSDLIELKANLSCELYRLNAIHKRKNSLNKGVYKWKYNIKTYLLVEIMEDYYNV